MSEVKLPEGYKKTEVGVIPEDWEVFEFGEIVSNTQLGGNYANSIKHTEYPLIKMGNIARGEIKLDKQEYIIGAAQNKDILNYGDILFNTRNTLELVGKVAIWKKELSVAYFNSNLMRISFSKFHVSTNFFINYLMNSKYFIEELSEIAIGTTSVAAIYSKDLFRIKLPLPSKKEQTAIATALSDIDNLIQSLEKLIAKKEAIKTGTMQQLLTGKTRLPEFATREHGSAKGFKQTELGQIPEDWELIKLGNYFDFKNGLNKAKEFFGYGTPIVNYMDVYKSGSINSTSIKGKVSLTTDEQINYSAKKGDVFFTRTSETVEEIGLSSVLESDIDKAVFSGFVLRARQKKEVLKPSFMKYCFRTSSSRKQIQGTASYTTRALTNGKLLSQILVPKPTKPEQTAIATILSNMDAEIQVLQQRLDKTRNIKQGMMQQLLTGKVRLAH